MKKTLQGLRGEERTLTNMNSAISKYNQKNLMNMNISDFRRLSYELLSQMILQDMEVPIKLIPK